MFHITVLMDNTPSAHRALIAEHGLSVFLEYNGRRVLFDCGSGSHFLDNSRKLGIRLENLDAVVLSHSHYDHAAGFRDLVESGLGSAPLFTGPDFFEKKYACTGASCTDLSAGFDSAFLDRQGICRHTVEGVRTLFPGMYLIGGFPRVHAMETIPRRFVRRSGGQFVPDTFPDEICLAAQVPGGLAMVVGCSHPGILNMVTHVRNVLGQPVKALFGGTHLSQAEPGRIHATVDQLCRQGLTVLGLCHCSGEAVRQAAADCEDVQSCQLGPGSCVFFD